MIRTILSILFLVIFLIGSIPVFLVEAVMDKCNKSAADHSSLHIVQWAFHVISALSGVRTTWIGRENIPTDEPVLYIGNHRSIFDIVMVYGNVPELTGFVSKDSNYKIPLLNVWMNRLYCVSLNRSSGKEGLKAILKCIDYVKNGISIMIFPEGTRNKDPENGMLPFKEGSFKIATKTGCKIVPVAILNTESIFEAHKPALKSSHVVIEYGTPIDPTTFTKEEQKTIGAYTQGVIEEMLQKNRSLV